MVIARNCGPVLFGIYATALAYATIATLLADNGLQVAVVREIAFSPERLNAIFSRGYVSKLVLFIPALVVLILLGSIDKLSPQAWFIAVLVTLRTIEQACCQFHVAALKAMDRMKNIGMIQAVHAAFVLVALWLCYRHHSAIETIVLVLIAGQTFEFCAELIVLFLHGLRLIRVKLGECARMTLASTPMGITFSLAGAILRSDVIVVSLVAGTAAAGVFAAAQTPIVVVYVVSWQFGSVLLPELARNSSSAAKMQSFVRHWSKFIVGVTVPLTAVSMVVGPKLVAVLFGKTFEQTGPLFLIMVTAAPLIFISSLYVNWSIATSRADVYLGAYVVTAVLAVLLSFVLCKVAGIAGVAAAIVIRELFMFCLLLFRMRNGAHSTIGDVLEA